LIAGADGNIDPDERTWAEKVTNIRSYSLPEEYRGYYMEIGQNFAMRLDDLLSELPENVVDRQMEISRRMAPLNDILGKLERKVGAAVYDEWCSFARHVARASGGFLKFWSISREEKKWIGLPMIQVCPGTRMIRRMPRRKSEDIVFWNLEACTGYFFEEH